MSTCPGSTLEEWLMDNWSVVIETNDNKELDVNWGVRLAEQLGNIKPRPRYTQAEFDGLVAIYEPHREHIESLLENYDDDYSWRDYNGLMDWCPNSIHDIAEAYVKTIIASKV